MTSLGVVAGISAVLEGAWALYITFVQNPFANSIFCPAGLCAATTFSQSGYFALLVPALGVLLAVDGVLGTWGARFAFPAGSVLSAVFLAVMAYAFISDSAGAGAYTDMGLVRLDELVAAALALAGTVLNAVAARGKTRLPEQVNPMNLPVFG